MARRWGRAPRGERVIGYVPHSHWNTTTLIGSLSLRGGLAPIVTIPGATNGAVFTVYVEHFLLPHLRPGDVVVLDNLGAHRAVRAKELIEQAGAELLFLPPYHPDLNPIELAWNKLKTELRRVEARSEEELDRAIAAAADNITASDVLAWFEHCSLKVNR